MLPYEALDYVLNQYKITSQQLADRSGVDKGVISRFRNGQTEIRSNNLQKLVQALPPQAKAHFHMLFSYNNETSNKITETA